MPDILEQDRAFAEEIAHPALRALFECWRRFPRPPGGVQLRSNVDPVDIAFCLDHVAIAEIETPLRVRYRVVGRALETLYGGSLAGRCVDELYTASYAARVLAVYRRVVERAAPYYDAPAFFLPALNLGYHRLLLPLTSDGAAVDHVMAAIYPADSRLRRAWQWRSRVHVRAWLRAERRPPDIRRD